MSFLLLLQTVDFGVIARRWWIGRNLATKSFAAFQRTTADLKVDGAVLYKELFSWRVYHIS